MRYTAALGLAWLILSVAAQTVSAEVISFGARDKQLSVDVGPQGEVYTLDQTADLVREFTPDGSFVRQWSAPGVGSYSHLAVDRATGELYVPETDSKRVEKFSATGSSLGSWPTSGTPVGVAVDSSHNAVVSEISPDAVRKYTSSGTLIKTLALGGSGPGQVDQPWGVAIGPADSIFVADRINGRVDAFDSSGAFSAIFGSNGTGLGQFRAPQDVDVSASGAMYVADPGTGSHPVQRLTASGAFDGSYAGPFDPPSGVVLDPSGKYMYVASGGSMTRTDLEEPVAVLSAPADTKYAGQQVAFDASGSFFPFGSVTRYEWDMNGDGTFETDSGTAPTATTTFAGPGQRTVSVRVSGGSATDTASAAVSVRAAPPVPPVPPSGLVGISINDGAQFTNDPDVSIKAVWPVGAFQLVLSNDGGFSGAKTFALQPHLSWRLNSSGPERLPKTAYARFDGTGSNYTDDIILDETPPTVSQASVAGASARGFASASIARSKVRTYKLKIKAADKTSGVAGMQITSDKRKPGKVLRYSTKATFKTTKSSIYVRAKDRAGNFSKWRMARR